MKSMKNKKKLRGFTLIELLTVVLIIGILTMASQMRARSSTELSAISRASSMAYTTMKLAKHLSILELRDYIFAASWEGGAPDNANWTASKVRVYCSELPFTPDGYTEFGTGWSASHTDDISGNIYVKTKPNLSFYLPAIGANNGATIEDKNSTTPFTMNGSEAQPWRTIFKYYGPCSGIDSSNLGRYYICTHSRRVSGIALSSTYSKNFHTVAVGGGNFSGAPYLVTIGIGL